jgi:hypothetical protein
VRRMMKQWSRDLFYHSRIFTADRVNPSRSHLFSIILKFIVSNS